MPQRRQAVTHEDLAPGPKSTDLGSKTAAFLMVLTILSGLFCFILCLLAEATRSKVTWVSTSNGKGHENSHQCEYNGSGKTPLMCAAIAFVGLAVTVVVEHLYMLIAISQTPSPALLTWDPANSNPAKHFTCLAGFFFVTAWICFAVGEILLLVGMSVESGHLKNWSRSRPSCLIIKEGLFSAAGVFCLLTVFLVAGLYLTALRVQKLCQQQESAWREILRASILYASPARSPPPRIAAVARENPIVGRETQIEQPSLMHSTTSFSNKHLYMV